MPERLSLEFRELLHWELCLADKAKEISLNRRHLRKRSVRNRDDRYRNIFQS